MPVMKSPVAKRARPADILGHWPQLVEGLQFSPQEFYARVERALQARQVPELLISRVERKEGGPLSPRREYLRLQRERLAFDVCAMPFGTGFFVSEWYVQEPLRLGVAALFVALAVMAPILILFTGSTGAPYMMAHEALGIGYPAFLCVVLGLPLGIVVTTTVWFGDRLDQVLIRIPFIGYFYERFLRRITYYRVDLSCAYRGAVRAAVCEVIDEITKEQGIPAPLTEFDRRPINRGLTAAGAGRGSNVHLS